MPLNQVNNLQHSSFDGNSSGVSNNDIVNQQYNVFISSINKNNKTIIIIDTDKFKEEYNNHYSLYDEELDGFFDDRNNRYTKFLISKLLDLKLKFSEDENISFEIVTKDYSELQSKIKETQNVDLKLKFYRELENEKTKCKELSLLFRLIFKEIIYIGSRKDIQLIMNCINNLIVNCLMDDYFIDQNKEKKFRDFISFFNVGFSDEVDLKKFQELLKLNIFEDIFIPSIVILLNKNKKGYEKISVICPIMKKAGVLSNIDYSNLLKDSHLKSKLYAHVIRRLVDDNLIDCKIDYSAYFSFINPNEYTVTLNFNSEEMELRNILKAKGFSSPILDRYNKLSKNPI